MELLHIIRRPERTPWRGLVEVVALALAGLVVGTIIAEVRTRVAEPHAVEHATPTSPDSEKV